MAIEGAQLEHEGVGERRRERTGSRVGLSCALAVLLTAVALLPPFPVVAGATGPVQRSVSQSSSLSVKITSPLGRMGQPEEATRATTVRLLCWGGRLCIAARCLDPQAEAIKSVTGINDIWKGDSLEMNFASKTGEEYPYAQLLINPAGTFAAAHVRQPFVYGRGPLRTAIVPEQVRARAGKDKDGWWTVKFTCRLAKGVYRIVVSGEDLAGNGASVVGRGTLTVK